MRRLKFKRIFWLSIFFGIIIATFRGLVFMIVVNPKETLNLVLIVLGLVWAAMCVTGGASHE